MALNLTAVVAKDGASTLIPGGVNQHDTSGTGVGPNDPVIVLIDSTGGEVFGTRVDAKAAQTDTTSVSFMSVIKQVSASIQALAASTGSAVAAIGTLVAGKAVSSEETATTAGFLRGFVTDLVGKLIVLPYANPENFISGVISTAMTATTSTAITGAGAPGSGLRNYITQITVSNSHATVGTDVIIQDGSGGTTLYVIPAAASYGGAVITLPTPLRQPTVNTGLYAANITTGSSTKVSVSGYKGA